MTLKLGKVGNNEKVAVNCNTTWHRYGFTHHATVIMPDGTLIKAKQGWVNRTWEVFTYQTVLKNLCERIAVHSFAVPSVRSLYKAKKWANARKYADKLKTQVDSVRY